MIEASEQETDIDMGGKGDERIFKTKPLACLAFPLISRPIHAFPQSISTFQSFHIVLLEFTSFKALEVTIKCPYFLGWQVHGLSMDFAETATSVDRMNHENTDIVHDAA